MSAAMRKSAQSVLWTTYTTIAARSRRHLSGERAQVLGAAGGHRIGELGPGGPLQMYVLDLDEAIRVAGCDAAAGRCGALIVADLAPDHLVAPELDDASGGDRLLDQAIGQHGVDTDQTAIGLDQLQGERQACGAGCVP